MLSNRGMYGHIRKAMHAAQTERQQRHPQTAKREQHGNRIGVVEIGDAMLALAEAQADRQADAEFAGFAAISLQPGQKQTVEGEQAEADQWVGG